MKRALLENLIQWKNSSTRQPLILRGARQVGKTWLMKEFAKTDIVLSTNLKPKPTPFPFFAFDVEFSTVFFK